MKSIVLIASLCFISCTVTPSKMNYGVDSCHNCSMTIVDQQHAAQLMTKKGKNYKFDASECMLQSLSEFEEAEISLYLVAYYKQPGKLLDATKATFIISPNIPSPMRGNISALSTQIQAEKLKESHSGELYTWEELQTKNLNIQY